MAWTIAVVGVLFLAQEPPHAAGMAKIIIITIINQKIIQTETKLYSKTIRASYQDIFSKRSQTEPMIYWVESLDNPVIIYLEELSERRQAPNIK